MIERRERRENQGTKREPKGRWKGKEGEIGENQEAEGW